MRIWSILLIKSNLKWCIHLIRSFVNICMKQINLLILVSLDFSSFMSKYPHRAILHHPSPSTRLVLTLPEKLSDTITAFLGYYHGFWAPSRGNRKRTTTRLHVLLLQNVHRKNHPIIILFKLNGTTDIKPKSEHITLFYSHSVYCCCKIVP